MLKKVNIKFVLFLFIFSIYLLSYHGINTGDDLLHYETVQNYFQTGSLSLPDMKYGGEKLLKAFMKQGKDGKTYISMAPGLSLVSLPLGWLGAFIDQYKTPKKTAALYDSTVTDYDKVKIIRSSPSGFFTGLINPILMACSMIIFFSIAELLRPEYLKDNTILTIICSFATIIWPYATSYWTQPLYTFCLIGAFYFLLRYSKTRKTLPLIAAGLLSGFCMLARYEAIISVILLLVYLVFILANEKQWHKTLYYMMPALLFVMLIAAWNYHRFGSITDTGSAIHNLHAMFKGKIYHSLPVNLLSFHRSIFVYSPPALLFLFAVIPFFRKHLWEALAVTGLITVNIVMYCMALFWMCPISWGPRFLVPIIPLMLIPAVVFSVEQKWKRNLAFILFILGFAVQLIGVLAPYQNRAIDSYWGVKMFDSRSYYGMSDIIPQSREILSGHIELWWLSSATLLIVAIPIIAIAIYSGFILYKRCLAKQNIQGI